VRDPKVDFKLFLGVWNEKEIYYQEELAEVKKRVPNFNYQFAYIHADVGEQGKTKEMVKEVTGLIRANGFEPKIKPESFAASVIADRYT
jgi:predicted RNase H-related nuclease YkuK (DUF458 family)